MLKKKNYYNIVLYKKNFKNLNKFINTCNNMLQNKVVIFKSKTFSLLNKFVKKLLYLGLINGYKINGNTLYLYFSYTKLGTNIFDKFSFISIYNDIKYVNSFFLHKLNLSYKLNFNKVDLFLFENNFYTLNELNDLLKNKNINNIKIIHICQIFI